MKAKGESEEEINENVEKIKPPAGKMGSAVADCPSNPKKIGDV